MLLQKAHKIGLGAFVLLMGASLLAMRPHAPAEQRRPHIAAPHLKLASVSTSVAPRRRLPPARHAPEAADDQAVDGRACGRRGRERPDHLPSRAMAKPLAGSGDPVTPDTVFRWASVSKGVAATMVAKLAEQGKINLQAPVANYAPDLKLPAGNEYRATVGDLLSHRLGLYRNAYDNKLEEGQDPSFLRSSLAQLNAVCAPGTCWDYQNVAYDASSEMVSRTTGMPYEQAVKRYLFNPIGMTSGSVSMAGLQSNKSWARPHSAGKRPLPMVDTYYKVPGAGGINSNIKDMSAVDASADGRDARRARRQGARHDPRALCGDPDRARAAAQVPRAARNRLVRLRLAQL